MDKNEFLKNITRAYLDGEIDTAINFAKDGYKKLKDDCFLNEIAQIYVNANNKKEAIKYYKKIYKNDPKNITNSKKLAYYYFSTGDFKNALKSI